MKEHKSSIAILGIISVVLFGYALTVDYPKASRTFWSDGATYYTMAHSLAYDHDLKFSKEDVERVFLEFDNGPSGIFIKKGRRLDLTLERQLPFLVSKGPLTEELFFAKSFLYSLAAAPFVYLFGTNGMLVLHAFLSSLVLFAGYYFTTASNRPRTSLIFTVTFFFTSVVPAYFVWLTPELFNLCLVFLGGFFWLYKERVTKPSYFLRGIQSDFIAVIIWGMATYSKPNNIFLILPVLILLTLRHQWVRALKVGFVFSLIVFSLFFTNLVITGEMNYQGGERKTFSGTYPHQRENLNFENAGLPMRTDIIYTHQPWDIIFHDLYFFFIGRFSGIALYFFPAVVMMILFIFSGERRQFHWLILGTATFGGLLLVVWSPTNYFGGGGTLGNRYFMNQFPLYFFLVSSLRRPILPILSSWAAASVFIVPILVAPFDAGRRPGQHATSPIFQFFPPELSAINHLPTNSDPRKFRQRFDDSFLGYFLDNNTWFRERRSPGGLGFHVRGGKVTEMVVRTRIQLEKLTVRVTNVAGRRNSIRVCVPSGCKEIDISSGKKEILEFPAGPAFPYEDFGNRSYCYLVSIKTTFGSTPNSSSQDTRNLGAFIHIEPEPYPGL